MLLSRRAHKLGVEAAWHKVYVDLDKYWDLYELAENLVDMDDRFQTWRFRPRTPCSS